VLGGGTATPEGVTFPGAYTNEENMASIYLPLASHTKEQEAQGHIFNSKYVSDRCLGMSTNPQGSAWSAAV
jgi:hypothetical protein